MKPGAMHLKFAACAIGVAVAMLAGTVQAQQIPIPTTAAEVSGPVSGTLMTKELELINAIKAGNVAIGDPGGAGWGAR